MTVQVRLRPEAERDLVDAAGWYEQQRAGLGQSRKYSTLMAP
jgi:plasmid stabilization system protein ParE